MEKQSAKGSNEPKKVKVLNTSSLQISENDASRLVGSIVEKGLSDSHNNNNNNSFLFHPFPKPTVLPFPVARHRFHGPHWRPLSNKRGGGGDDDDDDSDNNVEDEGDKSFMEFDKVSDFAKPVQRMKKKGLDLRKWKEIIQDDNSSLGKESDEDVSRLSVKSAEYKTSSSADNSVFASAKVDAKPQVDDSDGGFISSATNMELDTLNEIDLEEKVKYARISDDKEENEFAPEWDQTCSDRMPDYNFRSQDVLKPEQNSIVSCSTSNNFRSEKGMSLESEIDAENQARIKQMSTEEIAEAQAELMEKINPTLLKQLQKRGQEKMKKQNSLKSEVVTGSGYVNRHVQDANCLPTEGGTSHAVMTPPSENKLDDEKNRIKTSNTASSSSWNAWSNRVEAVRELRFSLAGDVVDSDRVSVYDNVTERDYLRTDGDPGAAGYTIKEAVALTRSVGKRSDNR